MRDGKTGDGRPEAEVRVGKFEVDVGCQMTGDRWLMTDDRSRMTDVRCLMSEDRRRELLKTLVQHLISRVFQDIDINDGLGIFEQLAAAWTKVS